MAGLKNDASLPPRSRGDDFTKLLARLDDKQLRQLALWKLEGYTNEEIAAKLDCKPATVEHKLRLIRRTWAEEFTL